MGGRGAAGSTTGGGGNGVRDRSLFQTNLNQGGVNTGSGKSGGANQRNRSGTTGKSGTGGVQNGGSAGGQNRGDSGVTSTVSERDVVVEKPKIPADADLDVLFEESDLFEELVDKYPGDAEFLRQYPVYFGRWLQTVDVQKTPSASPPAKLNVSFSNSTLGETKFDTEAEIGKLPENVRQRLVERGIKVHVGKKPSETERWNDYLAETSQQSGAQVGDGRQLDEVHFYDWETNDVFIGTEIPHSSYNIYIHELGHAVDARWLDDAVEVEWVDDNGDSFIYEVLVPSRDDPDWLYVHENFVRNNNGFDSYWRDANSGDFEGGSAEFWAEAMAAWFEGGYASLSQFLRPIDNSQFDRDFVIDEILGVWRRYGIIS